MPRDSDSAASPRSVFGAMLRYYREKAGMTQEQLSARVYLSADMIGKIENGQRTPTEQFTAACDELPELGTGGALGELRDQLQDHLKSKSYPVWFVDWVDVEEQAHSLKLWQPIIVPGLLQTADYAKALFVASQSDISADELDQLVSDRIERQSILDRPKPPELWVCLDETVLHRCIGSPKIMYDQLVQAADMSDRSCITVQVVPADTGAHAGLGGAFCIASADSNPDIMYIEAVEGQTVEKSASVRKAALAFDRVRGDALPRNASRDLILKVAEERWNT